MTFSPIGKYIRISLILLSSIVDISNTISSASMVDLVNMVCLHNLHETSPPS
jgi:hypothetical protein